jgi:hypothetical protein
MSPGSAPSTPERQAPSNDLTVFVVIHVLAEVVEGAGLHATRQPVTRHFDQLAVLPLALFDDPRLHRQGDTLGGGEADLLGGWDTVASGETIANGDLGHDRFAVLLAFQNQLIARLQAEIGILRSHAGPGASFQQKLGRVPGSRARSR